MKTFREVSCHYLKSGVEVEILEDGIRREIISWNPYSIQVKPQRHGFKYVSYEDCKPILKPLSSLTKPNDKGVIDIVELAKIAFPGYTHYTESGSAYLGCVIDYEFEFHYGFEAFRYGYGSDTHVMTVPNQLELFQYLYDKGYDLHNLIESGEAIAEEN